MSETTEQAVIDKSTWGAGPWQHEPDRVEWEHAGLSCLALRNIHFGNWCGYAAVPPGHPLHGVPYSQASPALAARLEALKDRTVTESDLTMPRMLTMLFGGGAEPTPEMVLDVHGGITYADKCQGRICHVPKAGEPEDVWWFGFDCGHAGDLSPAHNARMEDTMPPHLKPSACEYSRDEEYRTLDYVREQTNSLAVQLAELGATADAVDPVAPS